MLGGADSLPDIVPPLERTIDLDGQNSQAASSSKAMTSQCTTHWQTKFKVQRSEAASIINTNTWQNIV